MSGQSRTDNIYEPIVLDCTAKVKNGLTLAASQGALVRGAALGEIGTVAGGGVIGELALCDNTATDGSQYPKHLLADPTVDDSASTTTISVYEIGLFAEGQITFGGVTDLDSQITTSTDDALFISMRDALRSMGIRTAPTIAVTAYENT